MTYFQLQYNATGLGNQSLLCDTVCEYLQPTARMSRTEAISTANVHGYPCHCAEEEVGTGPHTAPYDVPL